MLPVNRLLFCLACKCYGRNREKEEVSFGHDPESDKDIGKIFVDSIMLEVRSLEFEKKNPGKEEKKQSLEKEFLSLDCCVKL